MSGGGRKQRQERVINKQRQERNEDDGKVRASQQAEQHGGGI